MHRVHYLLWLCRVGCPAPSKVLNLIEYFNGDVEALYAAKEKDYEDAGFLSKDEIRLLCDKSMDFSNTQIDMCTKYRVSFVDYYSKFYPPMLRNITDPPLVLYVLGDKSLLLASCVTIAGSRAMSTYGALSSQKLGQMFAQAGYTVVSGLAAGTDASAHEGALIAKGKTIGVLGTGIDVVYPKENRDLYKKVIKGGGAIITEYPFSTPPHKHNFPYRNRIMSGLSHTTAIIQGTLKSGSLITARLAGEQGRDVWALPTNIDNALSAAPNTLIADGVMPIVNYDSFVSYVQKNHPIKDEANDLLPPGFVRISNKPEHDKDISPVGLVAEPTKDEVSAPVTEMVQPPVKEAVEPPVPKVYKKSNSKESENMNELVKMMNDNPMTPDELCAMSGRNIRWITSSLTVLEISGKIESLPGGKFRAR